MSTFILKINMHFSHDFSRQIVLELNDCQSVRSDIHRVFQNSAKEQVRASRQKNRKVEEVQKQV